MFKVSAGLGWWGRALAEEKKGSLFPLCEGGFHNESHTVFFNPLKCQHDCKVNINIPFGRLS